MKNILISLSLLLAVALPTAAAASLAGIQIPVTITGETLLSLYVATFILAIAVGEYARRRPAFRGAARAARAPDAILAVTVTRANAYGIRPGRAARIRVGC